MRTLADELGRIASLPMPTTDLEHWRYSRIDALDLDAYGTEAGGSLDVITALPSDDPGQVVVTGPSDRSASLLGDPEHALDELHRARARITVVDVRAGVVIAEPILLRERLTGDGTSTFGHVIVRVGEGAEVTIHMVRESDDISALSVPVLEIDVADGAHVRVLEEQRLGRRVWQLGKQVSRVGRDATFVSGLVALGGDYARLAIESRLEGKGASGELLAVSFGEADQMHDFRTLEDHVADHTTSNMLFKGAVAGRSSSVYTGLIHIGKEARGSQAFQTNRNIKLSDGAWAESVPNLEIENNDVRCSHASAIGPIDEEQRFYLESRGVPPYVAERLIVLGFFEDVLERMPVQPAMDGVRAELAAKFARRELVQ